MKTYGGTYADFMDTPEFVIEMLLKIDEMYRAPAAPEPLGGDFTPTIS